MQNIFSGTSADKRTFDHSSPVFILFSAAEFFPSTSIYMIHNQNILRNLALERLIALWELGSDINYETLFRCKQRPLLGCWSLLLQPWEKTSWTKQPSYITTKLHTQFKLRSASSSVCDSQGRRSLTRCWLLGPSCSFFWSPWIGSHSFMWRAPEYLVFVPLATKAPTPRGDCSDQVEGVRLTTNIAIFRIQCMSWVSETLFGFFWNQLFYYVTVC